MRPDGFQDCLHPLDDGDSGPDESETCGFGCDESWHASGTHDPWREIVDIVSRPEWRDYFDRLHSLTSARLRRYNRTKRERQRSLTPLPMTVHELGERDGWVCYWSGFGECDAESPVIDRWADGRTRWGPTIEHIIPVATGGTNDADNLTVSHRRCNVRHGARRGTE